VEAISLQLNIALGIDRWDRKILWWYVLFYHCLDSSRFTHHVVNNRYLTITFENVGHSDQKFHSASGEDLEMEKFFWHVFVKLPNEWFPGEYHFIGIDWQAACRKSCLCQVRTISLWTIWSSSSVAFISRSRVVAILLPARENTTGQFSSEFSRNAWEQEAIDRKHVQERIEVEIVELKWEEKNAVSY